MPDVDVDVSEEDVSDFRGEEVQLVAGASMIPHPDKVPPSSALLSSLHILWKYYACDSRFSGPFTLQDYFL